MHYFGGTHGGQAGLLGTLLVFGALAAMIIYITHSGGKRTPHVPTYGRTLGDSAIAVVRVAFEARAVAELTAELDRITAIAAPADQVHELARLLRRARAAWRLVGATELPMTAAADAPIAVERRLDDARTRGRVLADQSDGALVTVVIAAGHPLFTFARTSDAEEVRRALEALSSISAIDVSDVHVVVTPTTLSAIAHAYGRELA